MLTRAALTQKKALFFYLNNQMFYSNDFNKIPFALDLSITEQFVVELAANTANSLPSWLVFSFCLFFAGVLGMIFSYKNFLVTMMSIELMYLGVVSSFVLYGAIGHDTQGSIYGLLILILAACESAIGLGILIVLYRFGRSIDFADYQQLGG